MRSLVLSATILLIPAVAGAQQCANNVVQQQVVQQQVGYAQAQVQAQVYYPQQQVVGYVQQQVIQPLVVQEVLTPAYVFQVMSAYSGDHSSSPLILHEKEAKAKAQAQAKAREDGDAGDLAGKDINEIARQLSQLMAIQSRSRSPESLPKLPPAPTDVLDGGRGGWRDEIKNRCASCHTDRAASGKAPKGGVSLFNGLGEFAPTKDGSPLDGASLVEAVLPDSSGKSRMPPANAKNASPLSRETIEALAKAMNVEITSP